MNKKDVLKVVEIIEKTYPEAKCSLDFNTPFEMLVAVCLSAQCTDDRVNKTLPSLFAKYDTPQDFADADLNDVERLIHSCGFYKNKAKNLKAAGKKIVDDFGGVVPQTMDELVTIPGVGRKSANVIMLEAFDNPQGIAVDTHVGRISRRIGLSNENDPYKVEMDLCRLIPKEHWKNVNHTFIWHGRNTCTAQSPKCANCAVKDYCNSFNKH